MAYKEYFFDYMQPNSRYYSALLYNKGIKPRKYNLTIYIQQVLI